MHLIIAPVFLLFNVLKVNGYSSGAPADFCEYTSLNGRNVILRPGHNAPPRNPVPPNYQLSVNQFNPASIRVTLRSAPGDFFRGFFVQATRDLFPLEAINRPAYGTFRPVDPRSSQPRVCRSAVGRVGGITHTDNSEKTEASFDWYPPAGCNLGTIQFVATVVKQYNEYWVDVRSQNVTGVGFQGERGLLCMLYNDPFNTQIQRDVIAALPQLRGPPGQQGQAGQRGQPGLPGQQGQRGQQG